MQPASTSLLSSLPTELGDEPTYRLKRSDWRGIVYFPGSYESVPVTVQPPSNFGGRCTILFFDKYGRETRVLTDTVVAENSKTVIAENSKSKAASGSSDESDPDESDTDESDTDESDTDESDTDESDTDESDADESDADESDADESDPDESDESEQDDEDLEDSDDPVYQVNLRALRDSARAESALGKTLVKASIKKAAISSREHERESEMRYEQARAQMILSHSYTREVAENHQVSSLLRRDLVAMADSLRRESQNRVVDSNRQTRQTTKLVVHLGKLIKQQIAAVPVPPPPPPPLDVTGLGIALINAVGTLGAAWGPNRPQLPAVQTPSQPGATAVAPAAPIADVALAKESEEEQELRDAILMAEQSGGGDAPSLIKLISRLAAKANLMPPGKKSS